jgi:hypothetical protein
MQKKAMDEPLEVDDPMVIQAKTWDNVKQKEHEQFEERIIQIFNNNASLSAELQGRMYDI